MNIEKRVHKRYIFPKEDQIKIVLESVDGTATVNALLLNISMGGLGLATAKEDQLALIQDANMRISTIDGSLKLQVLHEENVEIRWVLEHDAFDNICFGCEFSNLQQDVRKELEEFINTR